jgi:hypothetical protein
MNLLLVLSIPALLGLAGMSAALTIETLRPRLKSRPARVIQFRTRRARTVPVSPMEVA